MRVLVTGAAGFIGSHAAEALLALGHDVVGVDSLDDYYDPRLKQENARALEAAGMAFHRLDLATDPLDACVDGVDAVVHLAAQPGISSTTTFERYLRNNVVATQRLVDRLARARPTAFFVNGATSSIYGRHATGPETTAPEPISAYGVTKLCAEQIALAASRAGALPACSLRLYSVYGPRERPDKALPRLLRAAILGEEFGLHEGSETHTRSFTYVSDAVAGIVAAIDRRRDVVGEIVNIGSASETSMRDVLAVVEATAGRRLRTRRIPPRPGDQSHTRANVEKARRLLGYEPKVSLREGIANEHAWVAQRVERERGATKS